MPHWTLFICPKFGPSWNAASFWLPAAKVPTCQGNLLTSLKAFIGTSLSGLRSLFQSIWHCMINTARGCTHSEVPWIISEKVVISQATSQNESPLKLTYTPKSFRRNGKSFEHKLGSAWEFIFSVKNYQLKHFEWLSSGWHLTTIRLLWSIIPTAAPNKWLVILCLVLIASSQSVLSILFWVRSPFLIRCIIHILTIFPMILRFSHFIQLISHQINNHGHRLAIIQRWSIIILHPSPTKWPLRRWPITILVLEVLKIVSVKMDHIEEDLHTCGDENHPSLSSVTIAKVTMESVKQRISVFCSFFFSFSASWWVFHSSIFSWPLTSFFDTSAKLLLFSSSIQGLHIFRYDCDSKK